MRSPRHGVGAARRAFTCLLATWLCLPAAAFALGPGGRGGSSGAGSGFGQSHGRLLPLLPDGTPVEPSTDRAEFTENADVLDAGRTDWEVNLAGGAVDRLSTLHSNTLELVHVEGRRGLGGGLEFGAQVEGWNRVAVQQGATQQRVEESGYGPTTLTLRERLVAGGDTATCVSLGAHVKLPGASDGPGTRVTEGGVFMPASFALGGSTHLGTTLAADVVSNALDAGHHLEGVASVELSHDFGDHLSARGEAVSVWYGETGRPWLGVLDAGVTVEPVAHVGLTLGVATGTRGGFSDVGGFGRVSVHS